MDYYYYLYSLYIHILNNIVIPLLFLIWIIFLLLFSYPLSICLLARLRSCHTAVRVRAGFLWNSAGLLGCIRGIGVGSGRIGILCNCTLWLTTHSIRQTVISLLHACWPDIFRLHSLRLLFLEIIPLLRSLFWIYELNEMLDSCRSSCCQFDRTHQKEKVI